MLRPTRIIATAFALVGLSFYAALPANADPTSPPDAAPAAQAKPHDKETHKIQLTKGQTEFVDTASKLMKNGRKGNHLDWRKAKSYWGKHTTTRDDFVSGWVHGGGKLDNASKSTVTRLQNRWYEGSDARVAHVPMKGGGTGCKGVTKTVKVSKTVEEYWYDSCDTSDIIDNGRQCAKWSGIFGVVTGKLIFTAAVAFIFATTCTAMADWVARVANKSQYHAIVWRDEKFKKSDGTYGGNLSLYAQ